MAETELDLDAIRELASENNDKGDICRVLNLPTDTFDVNRQAREAYENGRAEMRVNLNHWQWKSAKIDTMMQMHLSKQVHPEKSKAKADRIPDTFARYLPKYEAGEMDLHDFAIICGMRLDELIHLIRQTECGGEGMNDLMSGGGRFFDAG